MGDSTLIWMIVAVALVLGLSVAIGFALFYFQRYASPEPTPMQMRLRQIKSAHAVIVEAQDESMRRLEELMRDRSYDNEAVGKVLNRFNFAASLKKQLAQAGMKMTVDKFILFLSSRRSLFACPLVWRASIS